MATVTLNNLTKIYSDTHPPAADKVSLDIAHGEFMVLLGPSGCGKTTTLRMIAGLESISSGDLKIDDTTVNAVPSRNRDIAMVFQSYALYPHMTVFRNLAFGLQRRKVPKVEIDKKVREASSILGLDEFLERKPHALSGGQRQRVALGRAIVRDPKVFLFDEPLSNLDAALRASTRQEICRLHRDLGATMIYVTHDQVEAMTMGTRICVMNGGRIIQVGAPLDVYHNPVDTFVAGFLGNPPMNLLQATAKTDIQTFLIGDQAFSIAANRAKGVEAGGVYTFGLRAERIRLGPSDDPSTCGFTGTVTDAEPLGAETLVTAQISGGGGAITARIADDVRVEIGAEYSFHYDPSHGHVFYPEGHSMTFRQETSESA
jgi:multiple sugar transport system ATP-binding protein